MSTLEICAALQTNKMPAVSSTAAATLQQLVVSTFELVSIEDSKILGMLMKFVTADSDHIAENFDKTTPTVTVKVDGNSINVGHFAYDALRVGFRSLPAAL